MLTAPHDQQGIQPSNLPGRHVVMAETVGRDLMTTSNFRQVLIDFANLVAQALRLCVGVKMAT
jgi:hypothetical protein